MDFLLQTVDHYLLAFTYCHTNALNRRNSKNVNWVFVRRISKQGQQQKYSEKVTIQKTQENIHDRAHFREGCRFKVLK